MNLKKYQKLKGVFIFVILALILSVGAVSAEEQSCCKETYDGRYCVFVEATGCDVGFAGAGKTCDVVEDEWEECITGACIDKENLDCDSGIKKPNCPSDDPDIEFEQGKICEELDSWKTGCCVINEQTWWETNIECKSRYNSQGISINLLDFQDISYDDCGAIEDTAAKGACVTDTCENHVTRGSCTSEGGNFEENKFCSDLSDFSHCDPGDYSGCYEGDIYNYDSCGQREDMTSGGNCKSQGDICGPEGNGYICKSLGCTFKTVPLKNGESVCYYDNNKDSGTDNNYKKPPIDGFALPGSSHWRVVCDQGEIDFQPCGSGRTGICQQKDNRTAFCIPNHPQECFAITSEFNKKLNEKAKELFGEGGKDKDHEVAGSDSLYDARNFLVKEMNETCSDNLNCHFEQIERDYEDEGEDTNLVGDFFDVAVCLPNYPTKDTNYCDKLSQIDKVFFKDPSMDLYKFRFECGANCAVLASGEDGSLGERESFFSMMNKLCVQAGDCGYSKSYTGEWYEEGFSYEPQQKISAPEGYVKNNRKTCLKEVILPHEEGRNWCGGDDEIKIRACKIHLPTFFNILNEGGRPPIAQIDIDFTLKNSPIDVIFPDDYEQMILEGKISGTTQEMLKQAINQMSKYKEYRDYFNNNKWDSRIDETWGWHSLYYIRHWQRKIASSRARSCGDIMRDEDAERDMEIDVEFICQKWQAPANVINCNLCNPQNENEPPCTEYKCKSLGASCIIINKDTTNPQCIGGSDPGEPLEVNKTEYTGVGNRNIPGNTLSAEITGDCFVENEKIKFNLTFNRFARCKHIIGATPGDNYENFPPGTETSFEKEHDFEINALGFDSLSDDDIITENNKNYAKISIKCEDTWGNENSGVWDLKYCIESAPDEDDPQEIGFEPENGKTWPFIPDNLQLKIYLNEVADCSFNYEDNVDYSNKTIMDSCTIGGSGEYYCKQDIEIIPPGRGQKDIWIGCNDTSGNINNNIHYQYTIENDISKEDWINNNGLEISSINLEVGENSKKDGTNIITSKIPVSIMLEVQTSKGINNGNANCTREVDGGMLTNFEDTGGNQHSDELKFWENGTKEIYIECSDADEISSANATITFTLEIDQDSPIITYTTEGDYLTVNTDEPAQCSYSPSTCNFNIIEGTVFDFEDFTTQQKVEWNPAENYYTKCTDQYGNEDCIQIGNASVYPEITRISYSAGNLKIKTDKSAKCYYDFNSCIFSIIDAETDGRTMSTEFTKTHSTIWNSATTYYIRCEDQWGTLTPGCAARIQPNSIVLN